MIKAIQNNLKADPKYYYALSIAASWAGVGSFMNSITLTRTLGIVPSLTWSLGNVLACIIFGVVLTKLPTMRDVFRTKAVKYILGFAGIFHLWLNMNGIREIFSDTVIGVTGGTTVAYAVSIFFIVILLWRGMIRNVLTDDLSWVAVYALVAIVTIGAFIHSGGEYQHIEMGLEPAKVKDGLWKAFLLIPGPFTFPYLYSLFDYNDKNIDGTRKVNMQSAFTWGGLMFGAYMLFTFALAFVQFNPVLNMVKAVLISLIAISTLSTFIYSMYLIFGRKLGLLIDAVAVLAWPVFISLGVMGVWQLVATLRMPFVFIMLAAAVAIKARGFESMGVAEAVE